VNAPKAATTGTIDRPVTAAASRAEHDHLVLPVPPDDEEKYSYVHRDLPYLTTVILIGAVCLAYSQLRLEVGDPALVPFEVFTLIYIVYQAVSLPVNFTGKGFDLDAHRARVLTWRPLTYPDVDIYLPICGEPMVLLRNTWTAVAGLIEDYPGRARAYVLDDGPLEAARSMAAEFGYRYIHRPDWPAHKKSGNLRYAFSQTSAEFLVILDADFVPRRDFLAETLPYMDDPLIAIVQTSVLPDRPRADLDRTGRGTYPGSVLPGRSGRPQPPGRGRLLRDFGGLPQARARAAGRPDEHPLRRRRAHGPGRAPRRLVHDLPADPALDRDLPR
jgi:cellulose synthase (UDP-forming)